MKLLSLVASLMVITFVDSIVGRGITLSENNAKVHNATEEITTKKTTTERILSKVDYANVFGFIIPHVMLCFEYVGFQKPQDVLTLFSHFPTRISTRQEKCFLRCVLRRTKVFKDPLGHKWSWINAIKFLHSFGFKAGNREADMKSAVFFCMRKKPRITSKYGCKNAYNFFVCLKNHGIAFSWMRSDFMAERMEYRKRFPLVQQSADDFGAINWNFGDMDKSPGKFGEREDFNPGNMKMDEGVIESLVNNSLIYDDDEYPAHQQTVPSESQNIQIENPDSQNKGTQPSKTGGSPNHPTLMNFEKFPTGDYYDDYRRRGLEFEVTKKKQTDAKKKKRKKPQRTSKRIWADD